MRPDSSSFSAFYSYKNGSGRIDYRTDCVCAFQGITVNNSLPDLLSDTSRET